jgi:hypothetical protein
MSPRRARGRSVARYTLRSCLRQGLCLAHQRIALSLGKQRNRKLEVLASLPCPAIVLRLARATTPRVRTHPIPSHPFSWQSTPGKWGTRKVEHPYGRERC